MPQRKAPSSLEKLAFQAISSYINNTANDVLSPICTHLQSNYEDKKVALNFDSLKEYLHGGIPRVLAVKMTSYLLQGISINIDKAKCTTDGFKTSGDKPCKEVMEQFILVCINPHLTDLDLSKQSHLIRSVLCENLNEMPKLQVLSARISENTSQDLFLRNLALFENLVSFNMELDCTNEVIAVLGQHCKKLKSLVVNSSVSVNDNCINSLLQLQCLEQLEVGSTSISEGGLISLLNDMAKFEGPKQSPSNETAVQRNDLKKLACGLVRDTLLQILCNFYNNLTHICLSSLHCDLTLLKGLKCVQELKLTGGNFVDDNVKGLIATNGANFLLLDFMLLQDVDLMWIGKYCPKLKTLNVRSCSLVVDLPRPMKMKKNPPFQMLQQLTFYVQGNKDLIYFLLVNCTNVKSVTVGLIRAVDDNFVSEVLSLNPLKSIEEFTVYFSQLTVKTLRTLMEKCPNLHSLGGLETWDGISQLQLWRFREELKLNNLNISVVR